MGNAIIFFEPKGFHKRNEFLIKTVPGEVNDWLRFLSAFFVGGFKRHQMQRSCYFAYNKTLSRLQIWSLGLLNILMQLPSWTMGLMKCKFSLIVQKEKIELLQSFNHSFENPFRSINLITFVDKIPFVDANYPSE